jgi:outer membrane protein OmpA-like peptidoglycan-associated protein
MDFGVEYGRIETSGRGEWVPIASNVSEWGRARNRRVEIHLKPGRK